MLRNLFIGLLLGLFVWVCFPLITPVAMGGVFALLFYPWFEKLVERRVPGGLAAALITVGFALLVLLPISLLIVSAIKAGLGQFRMLQTQWVAASGAAGALSGEEGSWMSQLAHHPRVVALVERVSKFFPVQADELLATAADALKSIGLKIGEGLGTAAARIPGMALGLVVSLVSLFFFLADGRQLAVFARKNSFFSPAETSDLFGHLGTMARSVVLASVASGLTQSLLMGIGLLATGTSHAGMVVFLVFLSSFLPLVGSAPVTVTVVLAAFFGDREQAAIVLGVFAILTSIADNVVRPWVLKGGANLHPLLGFVAAFGGLQLLGVSGLFLGPIIAGLFMAVLRLNARSS